MPALPTVTLDTTLADLYKRACPRNEGKHVGQVLCGANSGMGLSAHFPRNVKYLYQDSPFNSVPKKELTEENTELQGSLAMKYLSLVPQREAFISGNTAVILFNTSQSPEQIEHDKTEALKTVEVLDSAQRPQLVFCPGPKQIPMGENSIDLLAFKVAIDSLEDYPTTCSLDTHWFLNSKAALARSGLPTPRCDIIELEGHALSAAECCTACASGEALYIAPECEGTRGKWLNDSVERVLSSLKSRQLPFVLKNQQTFGGAGTYVINDEKAREEIIKDFSDGLLRKLFSQVTTENHHLQPGTVLLSDMVADAIGDYGLTFMVKDDGGVIFLAVSEQLIDDNHSWVGSTINYKRQDELQKKFSPIMEEIAAWLHRYGYYGPTGADILETKATSETAQDPRANMHIVDLNVRTSGSMCLPLLRGHFVSRGLSCGSSFGVTVKESRDEFIEHWKDDFQSGAICIMSWYEDKSAGVSIADIAIGGKDEKSLQDKIQKIKETSDEVTF